MVTKEDLRQMKPGTKMMPMSGMMQGGTNGKAKTKTKTKTKKRGK